VIAQFATESVQTSKKRQWMAVAAAILSLLIVTVVVYRAIAASMNSPSSSSKIRTLIDKDTGKTYVDFRVPDGVTWPMVNPDTGNASLYPTEMCFFTKDGKAKLEPTYVLLNEIIGKPGPTRCPDCGRTVTFHNPMPSAELLAEAAKNQK
jgi:hypothetical protein